MANYSCVQTAHKTLSSTTADAVTVTGQYANVEVLNRTGTATVYFTIDGTTPTSGVSESFAVPAGSALKIRTSAVSGSEVVTIVGDGNAYSVMGSND